MAQVNVTGDYIQVKTDITEEMFVRAEAYKPEALELRDEEGSPIFRVNMGDASQSKFGVSFCNTDADGKLFVTSENPCHDHSDPAVEKQIIKEAYAILISNLRKIEKQVANATSELTNIEEDVESAINFSCDCNCGQVNLADLN